MWYQPILRNDFNRFTDQCFADDVILIFYEKRGWGGGGEGAGRGVAGAD